MNVYIIKTSFNDLPTRLVIGCHQQADDIVAALIMQHPHGAVVLNHGPAPKRSEPEKVRARQMMELLFSNEPVKKS